MKVIQIGPSLARLGGPAGYLDQLCLARVEPSAHEVVFPSRQPASRPTPPSGLAEKLRKQAGQVKRSILGAPAQYRSAEADLRTPNGMLDRMFHDLALRTVEAAAETINLAQASPDARVLFTHDPFCAEHLLERRHTGQQVWLMIHAPFPIALYIAWCWGVPERDWREVLAFPDVQRWVERELNIWRNVDRLILPCAEAGEEFLRSDPRFGDPLQKATYLPTGAAGPPPQPCGPGRAALRAQWRLPENAPLGLYLGNAQPYRGLDTLFAALPLLPGRRELPGSIVIAGPAPETMQRHPRVRALGRVSDVSSLLQAVDFVINVNRFSLFDLSTIEALEAARPLLLHAVGGNKTFRDLGAGCVMMPDLSPAAIAAGLQTMFKLTPAEQAALVESSRQCYAAHLTPTLMWERHQRLYTRAAEELHLTTTDHMTTCLLKPIF